MKQWIMALLVSLFLVAPLFSVEVIYPSGFPYMGILYHHLKIPFEERKNIQIVSNDYYNVVFQWKGKTYKARLFVFGAIYLEKEGEMPWLLSFDVKQFRSDGSFPFSTAW
ncbi:hypothetical protein [Thermospira aquatica]|uniref:DUF3108 domain-containing protein n=1 Tax=Thermospira aquatica TaxID=2828656 RepID=A0AAX3BC88_9SPIR|nr:hypothetical protein [Thermospira aquatica]URA09708.1 hypothetical protein KDW03_09490 [Thermospira aquatica]